MKVNNFIKLILIIVLCFSCSKKEIKKSIIKEKSLDVDLLEEYAHHNLLEKLKQELHKLFVKGFSYVFEPVQSENLSVQCLNGHYSKYTYEKYTKDILLPLVTSR